MQNAMIDAPPPLRASDLRASPRDAPHVVVLVEDDPGDQVLFEAAISEADPELHIRCVASAEAVPDLVGAGGVSCILLDLGLPGLTGFEALDQIVARSPHVAVVVLTGWGDAEAGTIAVARGAQDYLVKGEADGRTIARSVRFAVERKRAELSVAALAASELRQLEQHRLERALLVDPAIRRPDVRWQSRYIAAREGVVSGDFFDGLEMADGSLRFIIGDVAGHGTDEAALGVSLRAGWRALVLAQLDPAEVLEGLEEFLNTERTCGDEFATVCDMTISADLGSVTVRSAGHPPPILAGQGALSDLNGRAPLGVAFGRRRMTGTTYRLHGRWSLVSYTDGLFEVRTGDGQILSVDEVPAIVDETRGASGAVQPDRLIDAFAERGDQVWRDDVAVITLDGTGPVVIPPR